MQLVDEFSEMFLGGKDVDASADVLDKRVPRDDRKPGKDSPPVWQS